MSAPYLLTECPVGSTKCVGLSTKTRLPMWKNREQGKLALRIEGGDSANSRARTGVIGAEALAAAKTSLVRVGKAIGLRRESQRAPAPTVSAVVVVRIIEPSPFFVLDAVIYRILQRGIRFLCAGVWYGRTPHTEWATATLDWRHLGWTADVIGYLSPTCRRSGSISQQIKQPSNWDRPQRRSYTRNSDIII